MASAWTRIVRQLGQKASGDKPNGLEPEASKNLGRPKPNPPDVGAAEKIRAMLHAAWDGAAVDELQKAHDAMN